MKSSLNQTKKDAEKNYRKLSDPLLSLVNYTQGWLAEIRDQDINLHKHQQKNTHPHKHPAFHSVATSITKHLSTNNIHSLIFNPTENQKVYQGDYSARKQRWQDLNLSHKDIEASFIALAQSRNNLAFESGYSNYIDMMLDKYGIPPSTYHDFLVKVDSTISHLNDQLPNDTDLPSWFYSEFNLPCFVCRMPSFPFASTDQIYDITARYYPILKKYKHKIETTLTQSGPSSIRYVKETDKLVISLDQTENFRHRALGLIHELGHAISFLQDFNQGIHWMEKNIYTREKDAITIETQLLHLISESLYKASLAEDLLTLRRVLFELELYQKKNQNLSALYAETFNRCFTTAKQVNNPLYLIDKRFITKPLSNLPHAIAREVIDQSSQPH